jgi:ribonucleoside-diphosphate reductase beta chain
VAEHLDPFVAATTADVAACFTAQARDEGRHARFFDRVAREVLDVPGDSPAQRLEVMRERLAPELVGLFEAELPRITRDLSAHQASLTDAVGLYHMLLEGAIFTMGQFELLGALDAAGPLPGVRRGVELVLRDERWHLGFGTRCLLDQGTLERSMADRLRATAVDAMSAWQSPDREAAARVLDIASRRLTLIELGRRAVPAGQLVRSL